VKKRIDELKDRPKGSPQNEAQDKLMRIFKEGEETHKMNWDGLIFGILEGR
jgi:hypothetical protein